MSGRHPRPAARLASAMMGKGGKVAEGAALNRGLLIARLNDIQEQLRVLRAHAATDDQAFSDGQAVRSARYALIVMVEAAAAICTHICARRLRTAPRRTPTASAGWVKGA